MTKNTDKTLTKTQYFAEIERSLSVTDEQWMFEDQPDDLYDTVTLTEMLLESGESAFCHPVFVRELFRVFHRWLNKTQDQSLKVGMYSRALLECLTPESFEDIRKRLEDYSVGGWVDYENDYCLWPALPEFYLSSWNWKMHQISSSFWEEKRLIKEARMDLIFAEKYPNWPKK